MSETAEQIAEQCAKMLSHYLLEPRYRTTGSDPKTNGYVYVEIPEWALRQIIEALSSVVERQSAA